MIKYIRFSGGTSAESESSNSFPPVSHSRSASQSRQSRADRVRRTLARWFAWIEAGEKRRINEESILVIRFENRFFEVNRTALLARGKRAVLGDSRRAGSSHRGGNRHACAMPASTSHGIRYRP